MAFCTLKNRAQFVEMTNTATRVPTPAFVLQYKKTADTDVQVGFTASKKLGNAVKRSRAKRRLRAVVDRVIRLNPDAPVQGVWLVLVARSAVLERPFADMVIDFEKALKRAAREAEKVEKRDENAPARPAESV